MGGSRPALNEAEAHDRSWLEAKGDGDSRLALDQADGGSRLASDLTEAGGGSRLGLVRGGR